jgi:hypothetical protein
MKRDLQEKGGSKGIQGNSGDTVAFCSSMASNKPLKLSGMIPGFALSPKTVWVCRLVRSRIEI